MTEIWDTTAGEGRAQLQTDLYLGYSATDALFRLNTKICKFTTNGMLDQKPLNFFQINDLIPFGTIFLTCGFCDTHRLENTNICILYHTCSWAQPNTWLNFNSRHFEIRAVGAAAQNQPPNVKWWSGPRMVKTWESTGYHLASLLLVSLIRVLRICWGETQG